MTAVRRNLIANFLGQGWVAVMGLIFIPVYIHHLGIEAYGLVGVFTAMQVWLMLLDMGLTPTISREMAVFSAGGHTAQGIRNLLRSVEFLVITTGAAIVGGVGLAAPWLAEHWLQVQSIPIAAVTQSIVIMGAVIALRLLEGIYRSCLIGLQQQVVLNLAAACLATFRWLGAAIVVMWIAPTIEAFFIWQAISSMVSCVVVLVFTYRKLPSGKDKTRPSWESLQSIGRYAGEMTGITLLAIILTQIDKVLLSRLLTLSEFGYYTLASTVAGGLYTLISPVTQAYFPKLCELKIRGDTSLLHNVYHTGAQIVSVIAGSAAVVILFFSSDLLQLWTRDPALTNATSELLAILMLGNLLNSLMWIPYQAQLAHGWTRLALITNIIAVAVLSPAIWLGVPKYGSEGAAWIWVLLNLGYFSISIHFMHRHILRTEKWPWYIQDVLLPLLPTTLVVWLTSQVLPAAETPLEHFLHLLLASALAISTASLFAQEIRKKILKKVL